MTNSERRDLDLSLAFLGPGKFRLHLFADAPESGEFPDHLVEET